MRVFGLTGGIASGKSTVAARFRERGVAVVDADALAREVVAPGTDGLAAIAAELGAHLVAADGTLDRKKVAAEVFADPKKLARLNAITHPRIAALGMQRMAELAALGEPLACYEAALLVENGLVEAFRPLVVVAAPLEVQIARAKARDAADEAAVRARIASQLSLDEKVRVADVVVKNDGTLAELRARADDALDEVCRRVGVDPARYPR